MNLLLKIRLSLLVGIVYVGVGIPIASSQTILEQFPNLFRGDRSSQDNEDDLQSNVGRASNNKVITIQPKGNLLNNQGSPKSTTTSNTTNSSYPQEGVIQLTSDIWNQEEIEIQFALPNSHDSAIDSLWKYKFRQSPVDQPKPHMFYGISNDDNDDADDDIPIISTNSINLVQSTVTPSHIPVVSGSLYLRGKLYQIRQLPTGEIVVDPRGDFEEFDSEMEIEDDDNEDASSDDEDEEGPSSFTPAETLEVDDSLVRLRQRQRRRHLRGNYNVTDGLPVGGGAYTESGWVLTNSTLGLPQAHRFLQGSDDGSQLDIMIVYSRNAMCAAAGFPNNKCRASQTNKATVEGIIELAVEEANEAFQVSGIPSKLRLVKLHYEDQYDDTASDWQTVFRHYTSNGDGYMDYIHAMRDQYGADFVTFIVNTRGYCGSAHRPTVPNAERAFSMVRWDCATGHYTFTHELAHTFGCRHNRESENRDFTEEDYNFGFQYMESEPQKNRFRTLMAYNCPNGGCQRILRFSNPSNSRNGIPYGTEQANNARFIRERLPIYAKFRPSVVTVERQPTPFLAAPPQVSMVEAGGPTTLVYPRDTKELDTVPYPGSLIGAAGNMFDVVAKTNVLITGFAVTPFAATTVIVEVYKLNQLGSFVGYEYDPSAWTMIAQVELETKDNKANNLPPGSVDPVLIRQSTTQAFYVTFQGETNYNRYSRGTNFGDIQAENDDLQVHVGYTATYPFAYHPKAPREFNGRLIYEPAPTQQSALSSQSSDPLESTFRKFETTFASNNGYAGNMFTIESKNDIVVEAFDINVGSTNNGLDLKIYTKYGDYSYDDADPATTWTEICSTKVNGKGESKATHVPAESIRSVSVKANERQSFYITLTGPYIKYTSALLDPNYLSNEDISLVASAGTQYPYRHYFDGRIWNGVIYYKVGGDGSAEIQGSDKVVQNSQGANNQWEYAAVGQVEPRPSG